MTALSEDIAKSLERVRDDDVSDSEIEAAIKHPLPTQLGPEELYALVGFVRHERRQFLEADYHPLSVVLGVRDGTDVAWIGCEAELQHLSSSAIRELNAIEPSAGARYVPETTEIYSPPQTQRISKV